MKYSVVIVTYNSGKEIGVCLKSIEKHTREVEVIVVDNASRDNTIQVVEMFASVKLIKNTENQGFSRGVNQGIRISRGKYIISLNPDTEVFPLWADRMAAKFERLQNVGAVGPLSTNCIGYQSVFNHFKIDPKEKLNLNEIAERVIHTPDRCFENNILIGFCLMTTREVLNHVGLLDERLFLGNDDLEFSWRLRVYGYKLIVAQDAFVAHEMQKSFASEPSVVTQRLVQESADMLYRKLARRYGKRNVPEPEQLWGIEWFKPSADVLAEVIAGPETRLKILLCYNYTPDTLPGHWESALRQHAEVTTVGYSSESTRKMDIPLLSKDADPVPAIKRATGFNGYDLFIWFESSLFSLSESFLSLPMPTLGVFSASSVNFSLHEKARKLFDHTIFTEYNVYRYFREQGDENIAHCYTNAFDETAVPFVSEPEFDVSFAGSYISELYNERGRSLLTLLRLSDKYKIYIGNGVYNQDYAKLIANSKIVVNATADGLGGVTMRAYETMGQGRLLITNLHGDHCPFQEFRDGVHYVTYKNETDLAQKIEYYLTHPAERKGIGEAARELIRKRYTYGLVTLKFVAYLREWLSIRKEQGPKRATTIQQDMPFVRMFCGEPVLARQALQSLEKSPLRDEREALLLYREGKIDEAYQLLKAKTGALSKVGNYSMGVLLQERREFAQARKYFEEAAKQSLMASEEMVWALPQGMTYERLMQFKAGVKRYFGASDDAALSFADRALSACALYRLAHIAYNEKNFEEAEKNLSRIDGDEVQNDKMFLLQACLASRKGNREGALKAIASALDHFGLDPQNHLVIAEIYQRLGMDTAAKEALQEGLDHVQTLACIDIFATASADALVGEYARLLVEYQLKFPEWSAFFEKGPHPIDGSWKVRRFSSLLNQDNGEGFDLNAVESPEALLREKRGMGRSFSLHFRNAQSLSFLEALTLGRYTPFNPVSGERVREFTFVTAENLLARCGYVIKEINRKPISGVLSRLKDEELIRAGRLVLKRLEYTEEEWERFFTEEFVLVVEPRPKSSVAEKKVSIVILTFNQLEYTRQCLESIRESTRHPHELILVDNGSTDGTADWLKAEEKAGRITTCILNRENRGVAAGWNQGMAVAKGEYLLILNNDILVAGPWLENMVRCAESAPEIGMVGPMSNSISGLQRETQVSYTSLREFYSFATNYMNKNEGNWWELFRIAGFAMLIKTAVQRQVGDFDERFGKGNFEDDDYCIRIRRAGYRIMVAGDCFIHHFGGVSFAQGSVDWFEQMQKNQKIFNEKWAQIDKEIIEKRLKNGTKYLLEEAERLMDAKDYPNAIHRLMTIIEKEPQNFHAYNDLGIISWYKGNLVDAEKFFEEALRLSPEFADAVLNLADVYALRGEVEKQKNCLVQFLKRVPDHIDAKERLQKLGNDLPNESRAEKERRLQMETEILGEVKGLVEGAQYDEAIGLLAGLIEKSPDNAEAVNHMGLCAWYKGKTSEAYWFFRKAVAIDRVNPDFLHNFADAAMVHGKPEEAKAVLEAALNENPSLKEIRHFLEQLKIETSQTVGAPDFAKVISARELNIQGEKLINEGLFEKAETQFKHILEQDPANFVAVNNLGLVQWYRQDIASAYVLFEKALKLCPVYEDALINIFDAALKLKRIPEIVPLLSRALEINPILRDASEILSQIRLRGDKIYVLPHYGQIDPSHLLNKEGRKLLDELKFNEATLKFLDSLEKNGENSDAYCGLGIIQFYRGEYEDAYRFFDMAVALNPMSQDALLNLYDAALKLGCPELVKPRLESALEIDPNLNDLRRVLSEGLAPEELT